MALKRSSNWIQIRKDLYKRIRAQVEKRAGHQPSIESYAEDYTHEFRRKWKTVQPEVLFNSLQQSPIVLLADFHALSQSQRAHLRVLNSIHKERPLRLGLECFRTEDQKWIDRFLDGKCSEREFLKSINWSREWGFPWSHYRDIVLWAQKNKIPVLGLNKKIQQTGVRALHERDRVAAQLIANQMKQYPESQFVVIYGDLHMAKNHLPLQIQKKLQRDITCSRVFQNSEKVYFQLAKRQLESQIDVVQFDATTFCLNSVPPWVKWQNYLLYLEQTEDREIEGEGGLELGDHVCQYVQLMAQELGLGYDLKDLSVYTAQEVSLWNQLEKNVEPQALRGYQLFIETETSFYAPQAGVAFLSRASVNHAATLAMHFLHIQAAGIKTWSFRGAQDFERLIWFLGFGYFGSKLINPKRKSDTLADMKMALNAKGTLDIGRESVKLALAQKMNELIVMAQRKKTKLSVQPRKKSSYIMAAELLGGILGERLYNGYRSGQLSLSTLQNLIKKDWSQEDFPRVYIEAMEMIEVIPLAFKSKRDRL